MGLRGVDPSWNPSVPSGGARTCSSIIRRYVCEISNASIILRKFPDAKKIPGIDSERLRE
jgi:hypothetical protein